MAQLPSPYFFDDFGDGNAADGTPVEWQVVPWSRGSMRVDQGDLVLRPSSEVPEVPDYEMDRSEIDVRAGNLKIANGSFRTSFHVRNPGSYVAIGLTARDNQVGPDDTDEGIFGTNLWAGLNNSAFNGFGGIIANGSLSPADVVQISSGGGFSVGEDDVMLQFDLLGDRGELTLWQKGEDKPVAPNWSGQIDDRFTKDGQVNLFLQVSTADAEQVEARFRYVSVVPNASSPTMPGDFDDDFRLSVSDLDLLSAALRAPSSNLKFDANYDQSVNESDLVAWVEKLAHTYFGDTNLDGVFNSDDLVNVFAAGQFEDLNVGNSTWATGDWNGDGEFTSTDFVRAFQDGGYEQGPRAAVVSVPEPQSFALGIIGIWVATVQLRSRRQKSLPN